MCWTGEERKGGMGRLGDRVGDISVLIMWIPACSSVERSSSLFLATG